jgi:hypothetical protein
LFADFLVARFTVFGVTVQYWMLLAALGVVAMAILLRRRSR